MSPFTVYLLCALLLALLVCGVALMKFPLVPPFAWRRKKEGSKATESVQELEILVRERTKSLEEARQELEKERLSLSIRVKERTHELSVANQKLRESARMKDEFLANMSHELRTPLNSILGLSQGFQDEIYGPITKKQKRRVGSIENSGQHLLALINDILDIAKLGAGELELLLERVNIHKLCESSLGLVRHFAAKKHLEVHFSVDETLTFLVGDQLRLKQTLINLLSNGIKFTEEGSVTLTVYPSADRDRTIFEVCDTGIGIAPRDIDKLFVPFVQLDSSLSRQHSGTGLGLSLVEEFVSLHGGEVYVSSELGEGSSFSFSIPSSGESECSDELCLTTTPRGTQRNIKRVAIVEDSDVAGGQLEQILQKKEIQYDHFTTGEDALASIKKSRPDLVFLDVLLPGLAGWEVLKRLKRSSSLRSIPVVMMSVIEDRARGRRLGAAEYLVKPICRHDVDKVLGCVLRSNTKPAEFPAPVEVNGRPSGRNAGNRKPLILLAEDNPVNLETATDYLLNAGFEIILAEDGIVALETTKRTQPDLILMDIQMPKMDGITAMKEIKSDLQTSDIPVIALTALAMEGDRERCLDAGATDYFSKPVDWQMLIKRVNELLDETESVALPG